jgi:hypothetical protein
VKDKYVEQELTCDHICNILHKHQYTFVQHFDGRSLRLEMRFHCNQSEYLGALKKSKHLQLVPLPPPRAVQSTAIRSASPVSTLYAASMNTERDLRSRISTEGSYALNGNVCAFTEVATKLTLG